MVRYSKKFRGSSLVLLLACATPTCHGWTTTTCRSTTLGFQMSSSDNNNNSPPPANPQTFREAEILGLRYMQEQNHEQALRTFQAGLKLPGSRKDVIRKQSVNGPSPVGGSAGGRESTNVATLDEFEFQAAHYNLACAHAQLEQIDEAVANLQKCFDCGFDNYATVRGDPDLANLQGTVEFEDFMEDYDGNSKGLFKNPFGFLGGN